MTSAATPIQSYSRTVSSIRSRTGAHYCQSTLTSPPVQRAYLEGCTESDGLLGDSIAETGYNRVKMADVN